MIRKFNVGIIGTGNIASVMAQTISKMKGVKLYAVASRQKVRAEVFAGKYGLLWPCKGLLPAAPKDAGFHAVQAQCPCRLGYPLKGS